MLGLIHSFRNETGGANSQQLMNSPTPPINEKGGENGNNNTKG